MKDLLNKIFVVVKKKLTMGLEKSPNFNRRLEASFNTKFRFSFEYENTRRVLSFISDVGQL